MRRLFWLPAWVWLSVVSPCVAGVEAGPPEEAEPAEPAVTFTGTGEAGSGSIGVRLGYYDQHDAHEGNPFLDEELSVVETVFIADYDVTDRLSAWGLFAFDVVSSASIARLDDYPQQSGASGDIYGGLDGGLRYELAADRRVGAFLSTSFERDYWSFGFGGNIAADGFEGNTNVDLSTDYFYDTIEIIRYNGDQNEGTGARHTFTATLTLRQILDEKSFGEIGGSFTHQAGFLETAYNGVVIREPGTRPPFPFDNDAEGFEVQEQFPNRRERGAVFGRVRRLLCDDTALQLGGSYAFDSWRVRGAAVEPVLYQTLWPELLRLRLRYRYYRQTASRYYDISLDAGDPRPRYRTQDSDYGRFRAHTIGVKFDWLGIADWNLDVGVDYTLRSDDLDFVFGSVGVRHAFGADAATTGSRE